MKNFGLRILDAEGEGKRLRSPAVAEVTTIADLMAALRRQYVPLSLFVLIGLVIGITHHLTTPEQYYTSATILVDERRSNFDEEITTSTPFVRNDTSLLNEIQVLKSLQLATEVAKRIDLAEQDVFLHPPSSMARTVLSSLKSTIGSVIGNQTELVETPIQSQAEQDTAALLAVSSKLQNDILIERIGLSFSIGISYVGHDPDLSALIVNTYAEAYLDDRLAANAESTTRTAEWMQNRISELKQNSLAVLAEAAALKRSDPTNSAKQRELAQKATTLDALRQTIAARYEEVSIQGTFPASNGRILTRSLVPKTAALPKAWRTLSVTMLLGAIIGLAVAVLRETRERTFRVSKDIYDHTDQAFLGYLPRLNFKKRSGGPAATEQQSKSIDLPPNLFWSVLKPHSDFTDTLRNIHANVGVVNVENTTSVIAITSMLPKEGKTTLAINYANMLAQTGADVILIDLDFKGQGLSEALNVPAGPGIFSTLTGDAALSESIQILDHTGLHVLPLGHSTQQSAKGGALDQHNFQRLITELHGQYDYIILDMPSLSNSGHLKLIIGQLDKIVLVCQWGKTPCKLISHFLAHEIKIAQKIVGIVLNKADVTRLRKYAQPGWPEYYSERVAKAQ